MKFIDDITDFIFLEDEPQKADIIFIPGGSFAEIAERAASIWCMGYSPLILPSGKYSVKSGFFPGPKSKVDRYKNKYSTEWEFLSDVLIQNSVDEKAILREEKAENTYENAIYSRKVTDMYKLQINKAIISCKSFHARRSLMYYQLLYPETQFIICPSETHGINKTNWFKSEIGIEKVMGELERCGSQFRNLIIPR